MRKHELTPLEKYIGYAIMGVIGTILGTIYILFLLWARNQGRILLCFIGFVAAPVVILTANSLIEHFIYARHASPRDRRDDVSTETRKLSSVAEGGWKHG